VRFFNGQPVPRQCIDLVIECANTAPSSARLQLWEFAVIGNPRIRRQTPLAAEEEPQNYEGGRLPQAGRAALVRLETRRTSYLDVVPRIVACFAEKSTGTAAVTAPGKIAVPSVASRPARPP